MDYTYLLKTHNHEFQLRGRMANEYPNCQTRNANPVELYEECLSLCNV
jgi:hypothetical protein